MRILGGCDELPVVKVLTPIEFQTKYYNERQPVVITEMTKNWKALDWSIDFFREKYGKEDKWISILPNGLSHPPNREIKMNFGTFLDICERQEKINLPFYQKKFNDEFSNNKLDHHNEEDIKIISTNEIIITKKEEKDKEKVEEGEEEDDIPDYSKIQYYLQQSPVNNFEGIKRLLYNARFI